MIGKSWDDYKYKVFVSYSHDDIVPGSNGKSWGAWLEDELEAFEVPKDLQNRWSPFGLIPARIKPVFRDRSSFGAGHEVNVAIKAALDDSATLVVVCSPSAANSNYVNDEIRQFKSMELLH